MEISAKSPGFKHYIILAVDTDIAIKLKNFSLSVSLPLLWTVYWIATLNLTYLRFKAVYYLVVWLSSVV